MTRIETNIIIKAKPEEVRSIFLDYKKYPQWNPFFTSFAKYSNKQDPNLNVGDELQIDLKLKGTNHTSTMYPTILTNTENEFTWKGTLVSDWLFTGTHSFKFESIDGDKTLFTQSEEFGGFLVFIFYLFGIFGKTQESFQSLNESLKDYIESRE
ncbi:hypothetical protein SBY92_003130 [Candida maltosa Xu316]|uniref:SRPBCC domain-containing protein n=1 Tax=Candida maltosa (strain Xu316) TaxID=1245528 RepID=M3K0M4_CANMX|nr:hypothetical protein G210_1226 [Candida maltosa Xu316]